MFKERDRNVYTLATIFLDCGMAARYNTVWTIIAERIRDVPFINYEQNPSGVKYEGISCCRTMQILAIHDTVKLH